MSRLRVSLDVTPLIGPPTGVARFVSGVLPHLRVEPSIDVRGWVLSARGGPVVGAEGADISRIRVPARALHRLWANGIRPPLPALRGLDIVHGTNYAVPPGPRSVLTLHDLTPIETDDLPVSLRGRARLIRRAVAAGSHLQVPTEHIRGRAIESLGIDPDRVTTVVYGLDPIDATADGAGRQRCGIDHYVLALGTTNRRKNIVRLAEAVSRLPDDVGLVIAGHRGDAESEVADALLDLGRDRPVRRLAEVSDRARAELLRDAAVLGYPSLDEGFGFPPLEAMSVGVPVVAGAAGSIPEVVGDAAVLVDPADTDAIAAALARALDPEARTRLVARGFRVAGRYDWATTAAGLIALYHRVAAAA